MRTCWCIAQCHSVHGRSFCLKQHVWNPSDITHCYLAACMTDPCTIYEISFANADDQRLQRDMTIPVYMFLLLPPLCMQAVLAVSLCALPAEFTGIFTEDKGRVVKNWHLFFCVCTGLWGGLIIGLVTEYFTSNRYQPVRVSLDLCSRTLASSCFASKHSVRLIRHAFAMWSYMSHF